jgi:hypothetical protein
MPDHEAVLAALTAYANKPATSRDLRAEPADLFGHPPFTTLNQILQTLGSLAELNVLIAEVAPLIRAADPFRGSAIAINCGTLVEMGGDPDLVFPHLLAELPRHLALARRAHERKDTAPSAIFDADPEAAKAAAGLRYLLLATMAVICRKAEFRQALRANAEIVAGVEALREHSAEADFVAQVLDLTDGMELLVLAPNEEKGFRVALEAVNYNAHLFTLLQAALINGGHLAGEPVDEEVVAVATGEAAPTQRLSDHARFHFSPWYELTSDGPFVGSIGGIVALPVDGRPAGIPRLDGVPIVLVGPKVFGFRGWDSNFFANIHDALKSRAEVVEVLSAEQVRTWLDRIKQARGEVLSE